MQRPPKRTSRGPRRLPRDTQRDTQRWSKHWSNSGQIVNPKTSKNKKTKNRLPCLQDIFKKPQNTSKSEIFKKPQKSLIQAQKVTFSKNLKKHIFFRFLGSRGLPREPQETQEGSQKIPKELQNLQKKKSKNRPQKSQVLERFWVRFGLHFEVQKWTKKESKK